MKGLIKIARRKGYLRDLARAAWLNNVKALMVDNPNVFEREQLALVEAKIEIVNHRMDRRMN